MRQYHITTLLIYKEKTTVSVKPTFFEFSL